MVKKEFYKKLDMLEFKLIKTDLSYFQAITLFKNEYPKYGTDIDLFLDKLGFTLEDIVNASWKQ